MKKLGVLFVLVILITSLTFVSSSNEDYIHSFEDVKVSKMNIIDFYLIFDYPEVFPLNKKFDHSTEYDTSPENIFNYSEFIAKFLGKEPKKDYVSAYIGYPNEQKLKRLYDICSNEFHSNKEEKYNNISDVKARFIVSEKDEVSGDEKIWFEDYNLTRVSLEYNCCTFNQDLNKRCDASKPSKKCHLFGIVFVNKYGDENIEIFYDGLVFYETYFADKILFNNDLRQSIVFFNDKETNLDIYDFFGQEEYRLYRSEARGLLLNSMKIYILSEPNYRKEISNSNLNDVGYLDWWTEIYTLQIDCKKYESIGSNEIHQGKFVQLKLFNEYFKDSLNSAYMGNLNSDDIYYKEWNHGSTNVDIIRGNARTYFEIDNISKEDINFHKKNYNYRTREDYGSFLLMGYMQKRSDDCKNILNNYKDYNGSYYYSLPIDKLESMRDELTYIGNFIDFTEQIYPYLYNMRLLKYTSSVSRQIDVSMIRDINNIHLYLNKYGPLVDKALESNTRKESKELANTSINLGIEGKILSIRSLEISIFAFFIGSFSLFVTLYTSKVRIKDFYYKLIFWYYRNKRT